MIEAKYHYGFLYAHHLELEMFNSHFPAFEVSLQKLTFGKKKWERAFNYPIIGITFFYSGLGNHPNLGQAYALMPLINFPLIKHERFTFGFRFALGLGYISKPFDRINNYKNLAIGSHLNAAVNLMLEARYKISTHLTLSGGISLQHFSNGSLKLPNYGINTPLVNIGIAYHPFRLNPNLTDRFLPPLEPFSAVVKHTVQFNIGALIGYKNMQSVYGENFTVFHLFENTLVRISRKSKAGIGFDLSYDPSQKRILESNGDTITNGWLILRPGINGAYELAIGQLGFIVNLGFYLGGMEKSNGPLYEKLCLQYNITKNIFAHVLVKVHWGRADYIGWGLGYRFEIPYGKKVIKN